MATVTDAVKSGDRRATLIALRDKIAETIDNCESGRDMAANSKRLMEVVAEIERIDKEVEEAKKNSEIKTSKHDRLKSKYENR